ncbi:MAG: homocysteine biosynthesis protein [Nitrospirae bacterium]|nr:homocysteine biosynthesis protein [Nitrospirota bacterium]MBI5695727.1 homocysteine biosynthesis protein [Nitrospirota bacterium]
MKSYEEINEKIRSGKAVVLTAEEVVALGREKGVKHVAETVDVVTTGTFGPMCSSGAFLNFGHSDPPIKMQKVWLNDVPVFAGLAAVDAYVGATELSENVGFDYGGGHVIEDLIAGKPVVLRAISYGTDCYPRREIETEITLADLNQAYLFNPRNAYQNYNIAVNSCARTLNTYMGILLPNMGNATYSTSGELSPLLNDPHYRTIGIGTRIFMGGTEGYVAWEGTQHNPMQARGDNGEPLAPSGTLALIGDMKKMSTRYIRGSYYYKYGISLFVGVGIPIPILDEEMARCVCIGNEDIYATALDYSVENRAKPNFGRFSYKELRGGSITINGKSIPTAPLSSLKRAREIADLLKTWVKDEKFTLTAPVKPLPTDHGFKPLNIVPPTGAMV